MGDNANAAIYFVDRHLAEGRSANTAFIEGGRSLTYGQLAEQSGRTAEQHAWSDGEDFELIVTVSESDADKLRGADLGVPVTRIGTIVGRTGLWKRVESKFERLSPQGHSHL